MRNRAKPAAVELACLTLALAVALILLSGGATAQQTGSIVEVSPGERQVYEGTVLEVGSFSEPSSPEELSAEEEHPVQSDCQGVRIMAGDDFDQKINSTPSPATFCVGPGTYSLDNQVNLSDGDEVLGVPGTLAARGPAVYGTGHTVFIKNGGNLTRIFDATGTVRIEWLDVSGARGEPDNEAGTGIAVSMGKADPDSVVRFNRFHDNAANGISGANGYIANNECFRNTLQRSYIGHTGACFKGGDEYEAHQNYVHDEQGFGIWCDSGCNDRGVSRPNGFWVHENLVVNTTQGVRYEHAPMRLATGQRASQPTALIENNSIHGSDSGAVSMHDAQNALIRNNTFGAATIDDVFYGPNLARESAGRRAIQFTDSGRPDRTDLWNGRFESNDLGGDGTLGCEKSGVACQNNAP